MSLSIANRSCCKDFNFSAPHMPKFIKTHWKAIAVTVGAVFVTLGTAYYTNKVARELLDNIADNIHASGSSFFDWLEDRPSNAELKEELERKISKIRKKHEKYKIKRAEEAIRIEEDYERDRIETEIRWAEEKKRDNEEAIREGKEWFRNLFWGVPDTQLTIEQNCASVNPNKFKDMSDFERLTHLDLNPRCCEHAKILLTTQGTEYNSEAFSTVSKINSHYRKGVKLIHPDKNPMGAMATEAFRIFTQAKEILKLCLNQY